tara:strand:- start:108 stop:374 length:267 start_codon:yes stop_codon:yes gene_type:complete
MILRLLMSPNKGPNIIKYCVITSTTALVLITISILPLAKKAFMWNICFENTLRWINEKEDSLEERNLSAKQSLAVGVCNGAVSQPSLK